MFTKFLRTAVAGSFLLSAGANAALIAPEWSKLDQFDEYGEAPTPLTNTTKALGNCDAVKLNKITYKGENSNLLVDQLNNPKIFNSTKCIKHGGNNDPFTSDPNLGWEFDGLLNGDTHQGDSYFTGLEFITSAELQALKNPLLKVDPGWIDLARGQNAGAPTYNFIDPDGPNNTINIGDFIDFKMTCTNGTVGECKGGSWELITKDGIIDIVKKYLGNNVFDHLAIILKAGNENSGGGNPNDDKGEGKGKDKDNNSEATEVDTSGGWVVYDFNFNAIFMALQNPNLVLTKNFNLYGTWDTSDLGNKSLSHYGVAARDPADQRNVSAPAALSLFGLGLVLLGFRMKLRR